MLRSQAVRFKLLKPLSLSGSPPLALVQQARLATWNGKEPGQLVGWPATAPESAAPPPPHRVESSRILPPRTTGLLQAAAANPTTHPPLVRSYSFRITTHATAQSSPWANSLKISSLRAAQIARHLSGSSISVNNPQSAKMSTFTTRKVAAPNTLEHRVYIEKDGVPVSPFHDIPLYANQEQTILNMIVEIPRWTNAKLEVRSICPLLSFPLVFCRSVARSLMRAIDYPDKNNQLTAVAVIL